MFKKLLSQSGLSLDRLLTFCLVAEAKGVTRAAKGDPVKQSLYSRQVKELEEFFGVELVRRKGRGIVLTSAGQRLHTMSRDQFAALTDFKADCQNEPLEIVYGAGESIIRWLLLPRLGAVGEKLPGIRYKFLNMTSSETIRHLREGLIDLGIVRKDKLTPPLKGVILGTLKFSLFIPPNMEAGTRGLRGPTVLESIPLAVLEGNGDFRQELTRAAEKYNLHLNIKIECSSFPIIAQSISQGLAGGILPRLAAQELQKIGLREVEASALETLERELCLAWNPRHFRIRTALEKARSACVEAFGF